MTATRATFPLQDIVRSAIRDHNGWELHDSTFWCHAQTAEGVERVQGWKLHLSATPLSAPIVLHLAADVLIEQGVPFKFARGMDKVDELTGIRYDRAQAGKFIAAYPRDDEQFHLVAGLLADVTAGLPGPKILSDRPYRPGSIVQFRYGAFRGVRTLTNDGSFEARLRTPDGRAVKDERNPWFAPPAWVEPLAERASAGQAPARLQSAGKPTTPARPVLDGGRFEVHEAIRHSARGGVYKAVDTTTGRQVIVKQARAHIGNHRNGSDSRELLAHEQEVLQALAPLTPEPVTVFRHDDHVFLAEEFVPGRSLADHIADTTDRSPGSLGTPGIGDTRRIALGVVRVLRAVHERGWVFRDLSTGNIMIGPDGSVRLIDPEYAARPGEIVQRIHTPGFAPPEVLEGHTYCPAAGPVADVFSVGAVLIHLTLGVPPMFMADRGSARQVSERIRTLLDAAHDRPLVHRWRALLDGLTAHVPTDRWDLDRAEQFLLEDEDATAAAPKTRGEVISLDRVVEDGVAHLVDSMTVANSWLWEADGFGSSTDPLNVQYGAAGVLATLRRAAEAGDERASAALPGVADWIADRLENSPRVLPGLYFGRSGTAWELRETAAVLQRDDLAERAERFALALPHLWPNPDVCHGASGAGLALLRMWQLTGDPRFLTRVHETADALTEAAVEYDDGVWWPVPADFDSTLAGVHHLGFAHGVAGVGAFLLAAGQATGEARHLRYAIAAGQTLAGAADVDEHTGAATWRSDRTRRERGREMRFHWCSGSSGVGTFLVRLAAAQTDALEAKKLREFVHGAALAVHDARWTSPTAACHGLAGNGQFLLDVAQDAALHDPEGTDARTYRDWAQQHADVLVTRHALRDGRALLPDESGSRVLAGYQTGLAGCLDLLLRLRDGGRRAWMVDAR